MKKIILIILGLILCSNAFAKTKFSEVKKALKEDGYGKAIPDQFHFLNSPKAIIAEGPSFDLSVCMALA